MLNLPCMKVLFCAFIFLYGKVSSNTIPLKGKITYSHVYKNVLILFLLILSKFTASLYQ